MVMVEDCSDIFYSIADAKKAVHKESFYVATGEHLRKIEKGIRK